MYDNEVKTGFESPLIAVQINPLFGVPYSAPLAVRLAFETIEISRTQDTTRFLGAVDSVSPKSTIAAPNSSSNFATRGSMPVYGGSHGAAPSARGLYDNITALGVRPLDYGLQEEAESPIPTYRSYIAERANEVRGLKKIRVEFPDWEPTDEKRFPILFHEIQEAKLRKEQQKGNAATVYAGDPSLKPIDNEVDSLPPSNRRVLIELSLAVLACAACVVYAIRAHKNYEASLSAPSAAMSPSDGGEVASATEVANLMPQFQRSVPLRPLAVRHHHVRAARKLVTP